VDELAQLVQKARAGNPDAEAALHARYQRFVERRLAQTRDRRNWFWLTELEDAVQETFIHFFAALREGKFVFEARRGSRASSSTPRGSSP